MKKEKKRIEKISVRECSKTAKVMKSAIEKVDHELADGPVRIGAVYAEVPLRVVKIPVEKHDEKAGFLDFLKIMRQVRLESGPSFDDWIAAGIQEDWWKRRNGMMSDTSV